MHQPETKPRASVFYDYAIHPFRHPPEMDMPEDAPHVTAPVVIVGAGPVGLLTAVQLARFGVASIVLESELQVSHGSRAIVLTRRSQEILQNAGVAGPFLDLGLTWNTGKTFYRGQYVYRMVMPHDDDDRFLPGLNLAQQYIEEFLVAACENDPLVDLRWGSKLVGLEQDDNIARLVVDTPEGEYRLDAPWVVATDGGRSALRRMLGLRMEGDAYAGRFVIADIRARIDLPTERICHFDPEWNLGNNLIVHKQPHDIWRLDFRLPEDETPAQALEPERLRRRIVQSLETIGQNVEWEFDWATVYSASTLTLPDYVAGRVVFAGDAAHLLPIFGVRGANTGFQDADNLGWKLALVANGAAPRTLLDSYSSERVTAAREICAESAKSTRFMTPPTPGFRTMRNAVLSLSLSEEFPKDLLHWRTSRPHDYDASPLNSFPDEDEAFDTGPACGAPLRNVRLDDDDFLFDHLGTGFHLFVFAGNAGDPCVAELLQTRTPAHVPLRRVLILSDDAGAPGGVADVVLHDKDARIADKFGMASGNALLARPDLHVCARWRAPTRAKIGQALAIATCNTGAAA